MGKQTTVGYRYFMGLHFGLCYGPVDALLEIRAGDRTAWAGTQAASGTVFVNAFGIFGDEEREGGVGGNLDVMMGEATQAANTYLASKQTGPQQAYRGIVSAVLRGVTSAAGATFARFVQSGGYVGANNPYLKPWAFKVRRVAQGWRTPVFHPTKATVTIGSIGAMNPAHILYQCMTDPEWGMGYPAGAFEDSAWIAAADALHAEGFGLCLLWARQATIEDFVQVVCNHIGAVVTPDRRTGRFLLKLIRGGYSVPSLPLFDESNILSLDSFERAAPAEAINEVTVKYRDPSTNKDVSVTLQNLASITAQGGVVSKTVSYPGIPTRDLAARVGQRDLLAATSYLAKVRFRTSRAAYATLPGDVIRFSWAALGIVDLPLRVGRIDYGTLEDGAITIEAVEDVFGLPTSTYVGAPTDGWTSPSITPIAPAAVRTIEAPYRTVYRASDPPDRALFTDSDCFVIGLAARPANVVSLGVNFQTKVGGGAYALRESGIFAPYGTTSATIGPGATSITLTNAVDLGSLVVGSAALLGNEIVRVTSVDSATSVVGIARGCADTVPTTHANGTTFFGLDDFESGDLTEYANGEVVDGRYLTVAAGGILPEGSGPVSSATMARRYARPYPPGNLRLNGNAYPASISGALALTWAHRDRLLQADTLYDTTAGSIGPEAGTTYTLELYGNDGVTVRRTETGLTGTSYTWATEAADSGLLGAERSASAYSQSSQYAGTTAISVANMTDAFAANTGAGTNNGALEWLQADLGSEQTVGAILVGGAAALPGWGAVAAYLNGRAIQWSNDGSTWTTVATISGVTDSGETSISFTPVSARYWRIATTSASQYVATTTFRLFASGGLNSSVRVRLRAVRGGFDSWQIHDLTVPRV